MKETFALFSCGGLIIASGLIYGVITDRWIDPEDLEKAASNLQSFPLEFGSWKGEVLNQGNEKNSGLAASISVTYHHQLTGKQVTVFLGCGRPGKVSIHTPDVCYAASGFDVEQPSTESFSTGSDSKSGRLFTARFKKNKGGEQTLLRIYWTWYADGEWTVSENPRIQYHGHKILYKLYVIHELDNLGDPPSPEVCADLLPKLSQALEENKVLSGQ